MSDPASTPGSSDGLRSDKSDELDDSRAAALIREVLRVQERHREGGVEPELEDGREDHESGG